MKINPDMTRSYRNCNNCYNTQLTPDHIYLAILAALYMADINPEEDIHTDTSERVAIRHVSDQEAVVGCYATWKRDKEGALVRMLTVRLVDIFGQAAQSRSVVISRRPSWAVVLVPLCLRGFMQDAELSSVNPQLSLGGCCWVLRYLEMPGHRKRRQFKQTDAFTRGMVIGLKRAGWSIRQIAADTHLGASTVHRLWRRWLEQGNVAIYRNAGATRVTSARVDRRILRQAVAAPQATCTTILQHVQDTLDHSISTRTISRRLVANGLHSCRPLRRLPLTPPNRRQCLEWCRARSTWMTEWHRVVFSDESRFCLSSDSRRVRVWRRRGERSNPAAIGVPNALYQQDNARPHTARISQQALQDVQMLPWPPYSPDLSPIEHVWDIIGRRLHALPQPRSEDELWQMVEREWRAIPQDAIRTLIDSLPRRVAACIAVAVVLLATKPTPDPSHTWTETPPQRTSAYPLTDRQRREQADRANDSPEIPASHGNRAAMWPKPCDKFHTFDLTSSRQCSRQQATINFTEATSVYKLNMERLQRQQEYKPRPSFLTELSHN
ncbi:hypothetical protein LAZ67_16000584 [Cordylochernes scorpioides]|uniref:Transposable element Tc1 transposase n=1 Tax=Cordylochernes scorpioides TaxID=51811 RepID=A0ABY6LAQ3_9ARAC|nr:hypothetical protein LAZ67_16000584 [Cordylochernes scorpioides]